MAFFHPAEQKDVNLKGTEQYPKQLFKISQKRQSKYSLNGKTANVVYFLSGKFIKLYDLYELERCEINKFKVSIAVTEVTKNTYLKYYPWQILLKSMCPR